MARDRVRSNNAVLDNEVEKNEIDKTEPLVKGPSQISSAPSTRLKMGRFNVPELN